MVESCCKAMYASPQVKQIGFDMAHWNGPSNGEEEETTIAIKSEMKDLEVKNHVITVVSYIIFLKYLW